MTDLIQRNLKELLEESLDNAQKREQKVFDEFAGNFKGFVLFGSGSLGRRTLAGLRKLGIEPLGFVDNNKELWKTTIDGLLVFSPEEAVQKFQKEVFVLTIWSDKIGHPFKETYQQLNATYNINLISFIFLYWKYPEIFLPYIRLELPHKTLEQFDLVYGAYSLFSNKESRLEYLAQIQWRLQGNFECLSSPVVGDQYFPEAIFSLINEEVFVDCGAFDGDTLQKFIEKRECNFNKYYAFEPDPVNFEKLNKFVSILPQNIKNKVIIHQIAIGDKKDTLYLESSGTIQSSINIEGDLAVQCNTLDDLMMNESPTYIKMDVEGFEPNIIIGATQIIQKYKPVIAISIYHKYDHLWRLPLAINALAEGYCFYLCPHYKAGWELVCYAVPSNRVL